MEVRDSARVFQAEGKAPVLCCSWGSACELSLKQDQSFRGSRDRNVSEQKVCEQRRKGSQNKPALIYLSLLRGNQLHVALPAPGDLHPPSHPMFEVRTDTLTDVM